MLADLPTIGQLPNRPLQQKSKPQIPGHWHRRRIGYDPTAWRFLRGFGDMPGKLHGLPKKVL